tara:strand:- start:7956 stop:8171 length:216 start_codon:yes stop_codon:yes gene_type:complete
MKLKTLYLTIIILTISTNRAFAYLDPGTGSIILQAILGFIAATLATLSFYWNKVKIFLSKILKKNKKSEQD